MIVTSLIHSCCLRFLKLCIFSLISTGGGVTVSGMLSRVSQNFPNFNVKTHNVQCSCACLYTSGTTKRVLRHCCGVAIIFYIYKGKPQGLHNLVSHLLEVCISGFYDCMFIPNSFILNFIHSWLTFTKLKCTSA